MKQAKPLRGYAAFDRIFNDGQRIGGSLATCFFLIEHTGKSALHVGYAVSSKRFNAVQRNRVRRLMREAVRLECAPLCDALVQHSVSASIVLVFRARPEIEVRCLPLVSFRKDIGGIFGRLTDRLVEVAHA